MDGKERVAQLRKEWNEARDGANPTHAATLGIESIVKFIEDMVAGEPDSQPGSQVAGATGEAQAQSEAPAPASGGVEGPA